VSAVRQIPRDLPGLVPQFPAVVSKKVVVPHCRAVRTASGQDCGMIRRKCLSEFSAENRADQF